MKTKWTEEKIKDLAKEIIAETLSHTCDLTDPKIIHNALIGLSDVLRKQKKIDILTLKYIDAYDSYRAACVGEGEGFKNDTQKVDVQWLRRLVAWNVAGFRILGKNSEEAEAQLVHVRKIICTEIYVSETKIIIINSPAEHHLKDVRGNSVLHNETGAALLMRDGLGVFAIEGIVVPKWIVEKDGKDFDPKEVLALVDVDQRRIAIKKMGVAKLCDEMPVIDSFGDYLLIDMGKVIGEQALYLKMVNPSNGEIHVEGVENGCTTVQAAINWRADRDLWIPYSIDGEVYLSGNPNQIQQGDWLFEMTDLVVPHDAKKNAEIPVESGIRHVINNGFVWTESGKYEAGIYSDGTTTSKHPQHNETTAFQAYTWGAWRVREMDHVAKMERKVID